MTKIILFIIISLLTGCTSDERQPYHQVLNTVLNNIDNDEIILTTKEIEEYNKQTESKTDTIYNLLSYKNLTKEEITEFIKQYKMPIIPKYDGEVPISLTTAYKIEDNRNLENVENLRFIPKGIIAKKANLRSYPTSIHFYDKKDIFEFDRLQETEVPVNTPCLVLHKSSDDDWYFIITDFYMGWIEKDNVGFTTLENWNYFIENKTFVTILENKIEIDGILLDMGSTFPLIEEQKKTYKIAIPYIQNGVIVRHKTSIPKDKAIIGFLPYTKKNIIKTSVKYLDTPYSWGGLDGGIDCSGLVRNVFKVFGLNLPRNTGSGSASLEKNIDLKNMSNEEKLKILNEHVPSVIYKKGHVMIYLGSNYIIHASSKEKKVTITDISINDEYLKELECLVTISN